MGEEKKLVSLNLCAYLLMRGLNYIKTGVFEDSGLVYFVFPQTDEVAKAISDYKNDRKLNRFLKYYKIVSEYAKMNRQRPE